MTSADRAPLALSFRRMEIFCASYEREFLEHSTHPRVVITMTPPRKTHLEALIEKAPVESKGFFFFTPQQLRPLGDSRPVSGRLLGTRSPPPQTEAPCLSQCPSNLS